MPAILYLLSERRYLVCYCCLLPLILYSITSHYCCKIRKMPWEGSWFLSNNMNSIFIFFGIICAIVQQENIVRVFCVSIIPKLGRALRWHVWTSILLHPQVFCLLDNVDKTPGAMWVTILKRNNCEGIVEKTYIGLKICIVLVLLCSKKINNHFPIYFAWLLCSFFVQVCLKHYITLQPNNGTWQQK